MLLRLKGINLHSKREKLKLKKKNILLKRLQNRILLFAGIVFLSLNLFAEVDGEKLFKQNCTSCHTIGGGRLVGPDLAGVTDKYEKEWLVEWIRNSQALIESGDKKAIEIFEAYNKSVMTSFDFSDEEFIVLLEYLENPPVKEEISASSGTTSLDQGMSTSTKLMIILLVLVTLVFLLVSVKNSLKTALGKETETVSETIIGQYQLFISNNNIFVSEETDSINIAFLIEKPS